MDSTVYDFVMPLLPAAKKRTAGGWTSFNGPCCVNNGQSRPDTRKRAGIRLTEEATVYHCFNCSYTASWKPGTKLSKKFKALLAWFNVPPETIANLNYRVWKTAEQTVEPVVKQSLKFEPVELPAEARSFDYWLQQTDIPQDFLTVAEYLTTRGNDVVGKTVYYWSPSRKDNFNKRLIIPFYWQNNLVGYTARATFPTKYRYLNTSQSHYIFNDAAVKPDNQYLFVVEGPFDALAIDGVAMLRNDCSPEQAEWLNATGKTVIVVPDFDHKHSNLLDVAEQQHWHISFPQWEPEIKDAADAVKKYGKLYTTWSIIEHATDNRLRTKFFRTKYEI